MKTIKNIKTIKRPVIRPCPCAAGHISCNYVVISHILGCPFNCSYCFLHTFYGKDEIVVYDNNDDIITQISDYLREAKEPLRVGTGQYSDSLALDKQTGLSEQLIKFFADQDKHLLELKTKSAEVDHLLGLKHNGRTIFAWSVNPQKIVDSDEEGAVSLKERLCAAQRCAKAGYPVAFHFDPVIRYPGWEKDYAGVIGMIFSKINAQNIAWISLGALRFPPDMREVITKRFPRSRILFDELEAGEEGKMRYARHLRVELFRIMRDLIRSHSKDVYVYLCMEDRATWNEVNIQNSEKNPYGSYFNFHEKTGAN
jgi:spore photoproduct lyase